MDNFSFDDFIVELKTTFNNKSSALSRALKDIGWEQEEEVSGANEYNEFVQSLVDSMLKNSAVRRKFDEQVYRLGFNDPGTIRETVDEFFFLADVNWSLGLGLLNSNQNEAIQCILIGIENLDYCRGIVEHELWQQQQAKKADVPVKGGKEKAARFEPMKTEIIRLLHVKSSPEGWLHKKDALRDIEDEINDYIAIHGWPSATDNNNKSKSEAELFALRERTIMDWSRNDPDVKSAFESVLKPKKRQTR